MKKPFQGGCVCGAVRYECTSRPVVMFNCHCRTCQQVSGGLSVPVIVLPAKAFKLTQGTLRYHFTDRVAGGKHKRGFCGDCGSRITGGEFSELSRTIGLAAPSLDDPSGFRAQYDIFTSQAQPWDVMDPQLPKHDQYPPRR